MSLTNVFLKSRLFFSVSCFLPLIVMTDTWLERTHPRGGKGVFPVGFSHYVCAFLCVYTYKCIHTYTYMHARICMLWVCSYPKKSRYPEWLTQDRAALSGWSGVLWNVQNGQNNPETGGACELHWAVTAGDLTASRSFRKEHWKDEMGALNIFRQCFSFCFFQILRCSVRTGTRAKLGVRVRQAESSHRSQKQDAAPKILTELTQHLGPELRLLPQTSGFWKMLHEYYWVYF